VIFSFNKESTWTFLFRVGGKQLQVYVESTCPPDRREQAEFGIRPELPTISKSDEDVGEVGILVRTHGHLSIRATVEELNISREMLYG
jgi:hypothetical protein